jgi:hypothetical protein
MEIFVVFKAFRQKEGEYMAIETEAAFTKRQDAEAFVKEKPSSWWETRAVPLNTGGSMPVEFLGLRNIHSTELKGL